VAHIEKPYTLHGARHSAGFGCIHEQSGCKRPQQVLQAHERDQQFGENESTDIGKNQRLRKEGHARINKVLAMRPGLAKIIEKVRISTYYETAETELHIAENACCIDCADTWTSERVY